MGHKRNFMTTEEFGEIFKEVGYKMLLLMLKDIVEKILKDPSEGGVVRLGYNSQELDKKLYGKSMPHLHFCYPLFFKYIVQAGTLEKIKESIENESKSVLEEFEKNVLFPLQELRHKARKNYT